MGHVVRVGDRDRTEALLTQMDSLGMPDSVSMRCYSGDMNANSGGWFDDLPKPLAREFAQLAVKAIGISKEIEVQRAFSSLDDDLSQAPLVSGVSAAASAEVFRSRGERLMKISALLRDLGAASNRMAEIIATLDV